MAIPATHRQIQEIYHQVNEIVVRSSTTAIIYSVALKAIYLLSAFSVLTVLGATLSFVFDISLFNKESPQLLNKLKVMISGIAKENSIEMTSLGTSSNRVD